MQDSPIFIQKFKFWGVEKVFISSIVSITQTSFTIIMDLVQVIQTSLDRWIIGLTELISLADQCTAT